MKNKYKNSKQRERVLDVLKGTKSHPTADWVYMNLKNEFPRLSLGTVYRNLNILRDMGKIQELYCGSTFDRFDGNPLPHPHFYCKQCGRVFDLELPMDKEIIARASEQSGFAVDDYRLEFFGKCHDCQRKGTN